MSIEKVSGSCWAFVLMFEIYRRQPKKINRNFEFMFMEVPSGRTSDKCPLWTEKPCSKMMIVIGKMVDHNTCVFNNKFFQRPQQWWQWHKRLSRTQALEEGKVRDPQNKHSYLRRTKINKIKGMIYMDLSCEAPYPFMELTAATRPTIVRHAGSFPSNLPTSH